MASKIARKTALIFGASLTAAPGGLNQFASFAQSGGTSAIYSTDPAAIQTPSWLYGWDDALQGGLPVLEDLNSVDYVHSYQIAYGLQQGIPEWDPGTYYFINSFCSFNGLIYISLQNNNLNQEPDTQLTYWNLVVQGIPIYSGGTDTGASNAYVLNVPNFPVNASIKTGTKIVFKIGANNSNTGASTLVSVTGQTALNIVDANGNAVLGNGLVAGQEVEVTFDGTSWRVLALGTTNFFPNYDQNRWWAINADGANSAINCVGINSLVGIASGSNNTPAPGNANSADGPAVSITATSTGIDYMCGYGLSNNSQLLSIGMEYYVKFSVSEDNLCFGFIDGFHSNSNNPQAMLGSQNGILLFSDASIPNVFRIGYNNGAGGATVVNTSISNIGSTVHEFKMVIGPTNTTITLDGTVTTILTSAIVKNVYMRPVFMVEATVGTLNLLCAYCKYPA